MTQYRKIMIVLAFMVLPISISAQAADASKATENISVSEPYARAVPPGQPNSAVFMKLKNTGDADRALVNAQSPVAKVVELHTHIKDKGVMKMRRVEKIAVPAKTEVILKPGGLHVMLIDLKQDLKPGDTVPVTLLFDDGGNKDIQAPVRKLQMKMKMKHEN